MDLSQVRWRKSSFSGPNNECVELAHLPYDGAVRDSKNPTGPVLRVDLTELVSTVKSGRLSH